MENSQTGLYQKYRPRKLRDVVGQDDAVRIISGLFNGGTFPRGILFSGPPGCGKTTLARILQKKLGCVEGDFIESNAADDRGIDSIRDTIKRTRTRSLTGNGGKRIWLIDEAHQLTSQAQEAMLKMLEDAPEHVHFFLGTTIPGKLIAPVRSRCTLIEVRPVKIPILKELVLGVALAEGKKVSDDVALKIADYADGSPRKALVILESVIGIEGEDEQLSAIKREEDSAQGRFLGEVLMKPNLIWSEIAKCLVGMTEDPEGVRRGVLGYAMGALINKGTASPRAGLILMTFRYDLFVSGKPGLTAMCWELFLRTQSK
jgi:replication-associated recombination protein RarA